MLKSRSLGPTKDCGGVGILGILDGALHSNDHPRGPPPGDCKCAEHIKDTSVRNSNRKPHPRDSQESSALGEPLACDRTHLGSVPALSLTCYVTLENAPPKPPSSPFPLKYTFQSKPTLVWSPRWEAHGLEEGEKRWEA